MTIYHKYQNAKYLYHFLSGSLTKRSHSVPNLNLVSLTARQYLDYALNRVKIRIIDFNPPNYQIISEDTRYLIFFDGYENDWRLTRDKILEKEGNIYQCVLVTYRYLSSKRVPQGFLNRLTRIRRILDLCRFSDAYLDNIFRWDINCPPNIDYRELTPLVKNKIREGNYPSLLDKLLESYPNIFDPEVYLYGVGHSISGAYLLRLWQEEIFDQIYLFSPSIFTIPLKNSNIDSDYQDVSKGIESGVVMIKVGSEKKDSFVRRKLTSEKIKCLECGMCAHTNISSCTHTPLFGNPEIPVQKKRKKKKKSEKKR